VRYGPADGADLSGEAPNRVAVGDTAPDFTLPSRAGEPVTLSDYRGAATILLVCYRGHW
jgi:peroxiredoxin